MNTKLYVGNLAFNTTESELQDAFAVHGRVTETLLKIDRATGRSRGFAFVSMSTPEEAQAAMTALDGTTLGGRNLTVNEARPQGERDGGGFGGGASSGERGRLSRRY